MGVVSIKFAELESVLIFMFATVVGIGIEAATKIATKSGTGDCLHLTKELLSQNGWSDKTTALVEGFIKGASILMQNRNLLMHSNLAWTGDERTILFKASKAGNTEVAVPTLNELRRVADDMDAYVSFGRHLANAINNVSSEIPIFPAFPLPDEAPPMPTVVEFSAKPQALRRDRK
jgi:hypothetical protein